MHLSQYALYNGIPEEEFWGIRKTPSTGYQPLPVWGWRERNSLKRSLDNAQSTIEHHLNYLLTPRYIENEPVVVNTMFRLRYGYLLALGAQTEESETVSVDTATDPVTVTTSLTGTNLKLFHSTGEEIYVDNWVGGVCSIPRCRLLLPTIRTSAEIAYTDMAVLATSVIAKSYTYGPATMIQNDPTSHECLNSLQPFTVTLEVFSHRNSFVKPEYFYTDLGTVSYLSGYGVDGWEKAVIALAHAQLEADTLRMTHWSYLWEADRKENKKVNPFGSMVGHEKAWDWAKFNKIMKVTLL